MKFPFFPYRRHKHRHDRHDAPALSVNDVTVRYVGSNRIALDHVSLDVSQAMRVALVGPNGAGKSTLLKSVAGLLPVASGTIHVFGEPARACHHHKAYLPQRGDVDWRFPITLERLVTTGRYGRLGWFRRPAEEDHQAVCQVLDRLQLGDLKDRQIGRLSGGQQQRALLARALVQNAQLLLLDEPLNAVDAETKEIVCRVITELKEQGKTVIAATHDLSRLASDFDQVVFLEQGQRVPAPDWAADALGDINH